MKRQPAIHRYLTDKEKWFLNLDPKSKAPYRGPIAGLHKKFDWKAFLNINPRWKEPARSEMINKLMTGTEQEIW